MEKLSINDVPIYQSTNINLQQRRFSNLLSDYFRYRQGEDCLCPLCTSTEVKIRHAKMENKPLEVKIGHPTPEVKVQIMSGENTITKVYTIRVTPDTGTTIDLISNKLANSLGSKVRRDTGQYRITGCDKN